MVALDVVEKLFWTAFDFLALRPRKFRNALETNKDRYLAPVPFAVATFVLYQVSLVAVVQILSTMLDWNQVLGVSVALPKVTDATTLLALSAPYALFSYIAFAFVMVMGARLVARRLKMRDALIGMCYACATFLPIIAYIGLASFIVVLQGAMGLDPNGIARAMYVGFNLLSFFVLLYFIGGAAAFGNLSFARLLVGSALALVLIVVILIVLGVLLALVAR